MKDFLKKLAILGTITALIGVIVLVSGVVPVKASGGHWPITKWLLDFASSRSIATHSSGIETSPLDEPGMLILGAGTYDFNCRWCHGRPGAEHPRVAAKMTPPPPYLPDVLSDWEPHQQFYVVKHGIKFAGMPAWPTSFRDDEIWPLVAFLQGFPQMTADQYQQLVTVEADDSVPKVVSDACAQCHGLRGEGKGSERVPYLAGQNVVYLRDSLNAYRNGNRHSGIMEPIAAALSDEEIDVAVEWFAEQDPVETSHGGLDQAAIEEGRRLVSQRDDSTKIADCSKCHGESNDPAYPLLAGQPVKYLQHQLRLFRQRSRGGGPNLNLMHPVVDALDESQSYQVASFLSFQARGSESQQRVRD